VLENPWKKGQKDPQRYCPQPTLQLQELRIRRNKFALTLPDNFKGTEFRKNRMEYYMLASKEQLATFIFPKSKKKFSLRTWIMR
jgi:hypothetical protein